MKFATTGDLGKEIDELRKEVQSLQVLTEERIRAIIRDELAAWNKRQIVTRRIGWPPNVEVK